MGKFVPLSKPSFCATWSLGYRGGHFFSPYWMLKNWCFWTVMLEKTLQSPLDCKEIKPVNPKRNQSWIFIVRTDAEAETPILGPPDAKNWLIRKDPDAGRDWRREEKGMTEDEMIGWHHRLNGHEFEQALGVGDGQGSLACCSAWGRKESDTEWLDWTELLDGSGVECRGSENPCSQRNSRGIWYQLFSPLICIRKSLPLSFLFPLVPKPSILSTQAPRSSCQHLLPRGVWLYLLILSSLWDWSDQLLDKEWAALPNLLWAPDSRKPFPYSLQQRALPRHLL